MLHLTKNPSTQINSPPWIAKSTIPIVIITSKKLKLSSEERLRLPIRMIPKSTLIHHTWWSTRMLECESIGVNCVIWSQLLTALWIVNEELSGSTRRKSVICCLRTSNSRVKSYRRPTLSSFKSDTSWRFTSTTKVWLSNQHKSLLQSWRYKFTLPILWLWWIIKGDRFRYLQIGTL